MRRFAFENGLALFFGGIFLATLIGQSFAGQHAHNAEQLAHGGRAVSWLDYVLSPDFGGAVLENWQSEFLQFTLFILATVWLVQKGSNESKRLEDVGLESDREQKVGRYAPTLRRARPSGRRRGSGSGTRTRSSWRWPRSS